MVEVGSVEELSALDGRSLIDVLKELEVERRRLEGAMARVVAAVDETACFTEDGHRSVRGCGHHNRLKSRGFRAHRDADGIWHIYRPDGTEIDAA